MLRYCGRAYCSPAYTRYICRKHARNTGKAWRLVTGVSFIHVVSQTERNSIAVFSWRLSFSFTLHPLQHSLVVKVWASRDVSIKGKNLNYSHIIKVVYFYSIAYDQVTCLWDQVACLWE